MINTVTLEADTRVLIDKSLENLGWVLNGRKKNVFLEQPKTEKERELLGGGRPDYVLYSKDERGEDNAIMVIEAKRRGARVDTALEQGIRYAKQLDAPLVFATDGLFCKSYHTKFNRTPILNGEEVDEFLREALAMKYLTSWEVNTVSPRVQYDRKELIKIFDEANNMLRGDGLRAGIERFGEFANILFLKLISENEQIKSETGIKTDFDASCHWDTIKEIPKRGRIHYINTVYQKLNGLYKTEIFTPLTIRSDDILKEIMDKLSPLTLTDVDSDVKGDAFEYFLKESTATKNDLGEYFTPRHIVKTMVKLVNPQIGEKVYDPFCGTGGFLIESFRHIWNTMARNDGNRKKLKENTVFGNEITNTARITKMNMILAGDGHSNIHMRDSLANPVDGISGEGYDIVITNMPYSQKSKYGELYDLPSNNGDSICVQHCMKAISATAENGRMALVVPEGFLFRKDLSKTRELLLKNCDLQSVISLPQGVFLPYTGVKTNIIYVTKVNANLKDSQKRKDFWYFDVKSDGYTLDNHRRKLDSDNDLDTYQEYRKLDDDQRQDMLDVGFEIIPLDKVKDNSYILVGSRYRIIVPRENTYNYVSLREIAEIIAGQSPEGSYYNTSGDGIPFYQGNADFGSVYLGVPRKWTTQVTKMTKIGDVLLSVRAPVGEVNLSDQNACIGRGLMALRPKNTIIDTKFLFYALKGASEKLRNFSAGSTFEAITKKDVEDFSIPVPSLEVQRQIVSEFDGYQRIIDGARAVVESYRPVPQLPKNSPQIKICELCETVLGGGTPDTKNSEFWGGDIPWITSADIDEENEITIRKHITPLGVKNSTTNIIKRGNVVVASRVGLGKIARNNFDVAISQDLQGFTLNDKKIFPAYFVIAYSLLADEIIGKARGTTIKGITKEELLNLCIPIPSIEIQRAIVAAIEVEKALVAPSKQLIEVFTKKIHDRINEIWGE